LIKCINSETSSLVANRFGLFSNTVLFTHPLSSVFLVYVWSVDCVSFSHNTNEREDISGERVPISTASRPALVPTQPSVQWVPGALSLGVKQLGREADHSSPSSAEVKNGEAIPPLLPRLHGMVLIN
jgi:hypothetical protein